MIFKNNNKFGNAIRRKVEKILITYWKVSDAQQIPLEIYRNIKLQIRSDCITILLPQYEDNPSAFLKIFNNRACLQNEIRGLNSGVSLDGEQHEILFPKILHVLKDENALLLEFIKGKTLVSLLRRDFIFPFKYSDELWLCLGKWLRLFHGSKPTDCESSNYLRWQFKSTKKYLAAISDSYLVGKCKRATNYLIKGIRNSRFLLVFCHGDFSLSNLILFQNKIYVIDLSYARIAPPQFDIERLEDSIEETIGFYLGSEGLRQRIYSKFLEGYGKMKQDNLINDLIYIWLKLQRIYVFENFLIRSFPKRVWYLYKKKRTIKELETRVDSLIKKYKI